MEDAIYFIAERIKRGLKCYYCQLDLNEENFCFDHFIPMFSQGQNDLKNIVLTCFDCNWKKNYFSPHDFISESKPIQKSGQQELSFFIPDA